MTQLTNLGYSEGFVLALRAATEIIDLHDGLGQAIPEP